MHFFSALLGVVSLLSMSAYAAASEPESIPNQYIVKLADNTPQAQFNHTLDTVRASLGNEGHIGREYNFGRFQGFSFEAPAHLVDVIRAIPGVVTLHPNYSHHKPSQSNQRTEFDPTTYALDRISHRRRQDVAGRPQPEFVYYLPDGQYIDIYVVDTGIRTTHEDFGDRATKGANFAPNNRLNGHPIRAANDYYNHGTAVAAAAGGTRYGAAKYSNIIDVRVFNDAGDTTYQDEVAAIDYILNQAMRQNRVPYSVINLSLGGLVGGDSDLLVEATQAAIDRGMFVSISAGNDHANAQYYVPANVRDGCTIGGTDPNDNEYASSNYGDVVDLWAPGSAITLPSNASDTATGVKYGTSFSAPLVAGIAAIFKSYTGTENFASYTPQSLCQFLVNTATSNVINFQSYGGDYPGPNKLLYYGAE